MQYTETAAGGAVTVSAAELTRHRQNVLLTAEDARRFSCLDNLSQNVCKEALLDCGGTRFLVRAEPEGYSDGTDGAPRTLVEFYEERPAKIQPAARKASLHALVCAAVFAAQDGRDIVIRRVLLTRGEPRRLTSFSDTVYHADDLLARLQLLLESKKKKQILKPTAHKRSRRRSAR